MSSFDLGTDDSEDLRRALRTALAGGGIELSATELRVTLGDPHVFAASIPRSSIRSVERIADLRGPTRGVHGSFGRWLVNRSGTGIVRLTISPAGRAELAPPALVPSPGILLRFLLRRRTVRLRQLTISTSRPDDLVRALTTGESL